jgi:hypothetical protein
MPEIQEVVADRVAHAEQRQRTLDYHARYNKDHQEAIKAAKRKKYAEDPAYREAALKRAHERYETQKKLRQEIRKSTGIMASPARKRGTNAYMYCPMCLQSIPRPVKPIFKSIQKKYLVAMFTVREVARRLGKQTTTVIKMIRADHLLPETLYKEQRSGTVPTRLWTQDQVEMLMRVFDKYDTRPPVSYEGIGLTKEIRTEWDKLRPFGIDPKLYTVKDEETGFLARPSYELPLPKFAARSEKTAKKEKKSGAEKG